MRPRLPTHSISRDNFTQYRVGSRAPSLQQGWLCIDDGAGKPLLVPWLTVYLTLSSSWAAFLPRKRKCVAQRSSGFASKHRDGGEKGRRGSWPTLWQPQGEQQRKSCWRTAGRIKSASAGSAVGKGQRLWQSVGRCEKLRSSDSRLCWKCPEGLSIPTQGWLPWGGGSHASHPGACPPQPGTPWHACHGPVAPHCSYLHPI